MEIKQQLPTNSTFSKVLAGISIRPTSLTLGAQPPEIKTRPPASQRLAAHHCGGAAQKVLVPHFFGKPTNFFHSSGKSETCRTPLRRSRAEGFGFSLLRQVSKSLPFLRQVRDLRHITAAEPRKDLVFRSFGKLASLFHPFGKSETCSTSLRQSRTGI